MRLLLATAKPVTGISSGSKSSSSLSSDSPSLSDARERNESRSE